MILDFKKTETVFAQQFWRAMFIAKVFALCVAVAGLVSNAALATTFTTTVPGTSIVIPTTYPQAGGVVIVLEGVNGNVYYQFANPSTMFQGYQNSGTPAAWNGNPFQITPLMPLNCGPVVSCSTYLGGGVTRMSVRFTAWDGDNQAGMFDVNDLTLRINGFDFGANGGNWTPVTTQNTDLAGTTLISSGTGFGNNTLDTGWFQSTTPAILANVLSTGGVTASIFDRDPNDNFWDFKRGNDAVTSVVPLNVAPGVTLDKASTTTSFSTVGQVIPYTFTYRNVGSVWINTVAVSDPKVTGVSCPAPPAAGTVNLDPGEQVVCTANYTVTQGDIDAGRVLNTATATGVPQAGALGPVTDSNTIPGPTSAPGVELTKTAAPTVFGVSGSTLTYSFAVKNTGNVTLTNVSIADPSLASLSCTTPAIAPGATVVATCTGNTRTITQANVDGGTLVNTATVSARAPNATVVTAPSSIITNGPARIGGITLVKSASAITDLDANGHDMGDTVAYTFTVANTGNVTLTGIAVSDAKINLINCPTTTLLPGASTNCTGTYTLTQVDVNGGSTTNTASVTSTPPAGVTGPVIDTSGTANNNDTPTVVAITRTPALVTDKTSPTANFDSVGDVLTYNYSVRNSGNVTITDAITVNDNKAAVTCPPLSGGELLPGGILNCSASYTVTQADIDAGSVVNIASAATTFNGAPVTSPNDQVSVPAVQSRAMTVAKSATSVNFNVIGDLVTYQYIITNTGNTTLTDPVTITDNRVASVNCPALPAGGLAPAATHTCTATYSVTLGDLDFGSVTNLATASSGTTTSPQTSLTVPTAGTTNLSISKTSTTANFNVVGDVIAYTFLVTNSGSKTFTKTVTVTDDKIGTFDCWVPAGRVFLPAETLICNANYTVTQADLDRGFVTNQAYAATTYSDANVPVTSAPDDLTINAIQNPAMTVTKSAATLPVTAVGQVLTYTITTLNSGDVTLSGINVTDPNIPALSCSRASLAPTVSFQCTGTYTVTQADFDAGVVNNTATANGNTPQGVAVTDDGINAVTITQNSSVTIDKNFVSNADQDGSNSVSLNDALTFEVIVQNNGNVTQNNVVVSDALLTPASQTCAIVLPGANCTLTGTLIVTQAQVDSGTVANTGSVTTTLLPVAETAVESVTVPRISSLSVDKQDPVNGDQDTSNSVTLNDVLTYTVVVTNTGNVTQTNVEVNDPQLTPASNTCVSVAPGASCTLVGTKTVTQGDINAGGITNTASTTSALITTPVTDAVTTPVAQNSSLTIAKAVAGNADQDISSSITLNDTLTYAVTATNDGTVTQTNVVVSDPKLTPNSITCASLAPAASCVLTGTLNVTQVNVDTGSIANTGSVTSTLLPTAETVSISTPIPQTRSLTLDKQRITLNFNAVGNVLSYTYLLTNTGNVTLTGTLSVTDNKTSVSCPALPPAGLAPGALHSCTATYVATQTDLNVGNVTNIATARIGTTVSPNDTVIIPAVQLPALTVDKSSPTASFAAVGDTLTYSYLVRNTGNVTIRSAVTISDNKATVSCPALPGGVLLPSTTHTCSASYTVTQDDIDAGGVTNTAYAATTFGVTPVTSPTDAVTVPAVQTRKLSIAKGASSVNFTVVGDIVTYDYLVTNSGNTTLTDPVTVADNRVTPVNCPALPLGGFAPGDTMTCTSTYSVTLEDLDIGSITNIAVASSGATSSPQDAVTVPTGANPALTIAKSSPAPSFNNLGDVVSYRYTVTNSGNASLTRAIPVVDDKIGTIACWAPTAGDLTFTPGETKICTANYAVTQADLDRGFVTNQAFASTTYGAANIPVTSPPKAVTANAVQNPELTVTKSAATLPVSAAGQELTYTITAKNTGDVTLSNVTVADPLIPSLSCNQASLAPSASLVCNGNYTVTQADFDRGVVNNTATANASTPQGAPVTDTGALATTMAAPRPALTLVKTATPSSFQSVGETIDYAFTVTNSGDVTLTNIRVTDPLVPAFSCVIPAMPPGATNTSCATNLLITQAHIDAGAIANTAAVGASASRGTDPSTTANETIAGPTREPLVTVSKSATPATYSAVGDVISYEYVVSNGGNISLVGAVTISDDKLGTLSCPALPVAGIAPGGSLTCTVNHAITQAEIDAGSVTNTASANTQTALGLLSSAPDSETVTANQSPAVSVVKSAGAIVDGDGNGTDAGDTIAYTFVVKNEGNVSLTSVGVSDPKVGTVSCPVTSLAPGISTNCTATYTLTQVDVNSGQVTNSAVASGTPPTGPAVTDQSGSSAAGDQPTVTAIPSNSRIAVVKQAGAIVDVDGNGEDAGDSIAYTFAVSNEGNTSLTSVGVTDPKIGAVSCPVATLEPAVSTVCTATYTLTQADVDATRVTNTATASGTPPTGAAISDLSGSATDNNTPTVSNIPVTPTITLVKSAAPIADQDGNGSDAGDLVTYTFAVTNTGNVTLASVVVTDLKVSPISCPVASLAPGASTNCTGNYTLTQGDVNTGSATNTATVRANPPVGIPGPVTDTSGTAGNNNTPTIVTVPQIPAVSVEKTSPTPSFDAVGDVLSYSYLVRNIGNTTLSNAITIADDKATVSCPAVPAGGLQPTRTISCSASYTVTQADINANGVTNIARASTTFGATAVTSADDQVSVPAVQTRTMTIVKTATSVNFINVGDQVTYQYVVTNTGNTTLTDAISVTDNRIPAVNCPALPAGGLAPGATHTCTATYALLLEDIDIGSVTNLASATSGSTTSPQTFVTVPSSSTSALTVEKISTTANFDKVGDTVSYSFTLTNSGGATFTRAITVTDDKIGSLSCWAPAGADLTFTPGETSLCTANYTVTQADLDSGFVTNQASVSTTYGAANVLVTSPPDTVTVNAIQNPGFTVSKSVATLPVTAVNQSLTYTITAQNSGDITLKTVTVTDPLIPGFNCSAALLAPGASLVCDGNYVVTQEDFDAGTINNTATANGVTPQGNPVTGTGTNAVTIAQTPAIAVVKSAGAIADLDGDGPEAGDTIDYTFAVSNEGNVTLSAIAVTDVKVGAVTCAAIVIAPSEKTICTATYALTQADVDLGTVTNSATATGKPPIGPVVSDTSGGSKTDDIDTVSTFTATAAVRLVKTASPIVDLYPDAGDTITYTFAVTNTGNLTLSGIGIVDDKISAVVCPVASLQPGDVANCSGTYTLKQEDVDTGKAINTATVSARSPNAIVVSDVSGSALGNDDDTVSAIPANPAVSLVKLPGVLTDSDGNGADIGDTLTYAFTVKNEGNVTLTGLTVTDSEPKATMSGGPIASLAPGASDATTFSASYVLTQADVDAGTVANTALVSGNPPTGPPATDVSGTTPTNDTQTDTGIPRAPALRLVKTATGITDEDGNGHDVGDTVTYTFEIFNTGNTTLTDVAVDDPLIGLAALPNTNAMANMVALAAIKADPILTASVVRLNDAITADKRSVSQYVTGLIFGNDAVPSLPTSLVLERKVIRLSEKTGPFEAGERVGITYKLVNAGEGPVTMIEAVLPRAQMVGSGLGILAANSSDLFPAIFAYDLTAEDVATGSFATSGTLTYRARDVAFETDLAATVSLASVGLPKDLLTASISPARIPSLQPGDKAIFSGTYVLKQKDVDAGKVDNTAKGSGRAPDGNIYDDTSGTATDNDTSTTIEVPRAPAITLVKSASEIKDLDGNGPDEGDAIDYTFVVANEGNVTLTSLAITDAKVGAVSCAATTLGPPGSTTPPASTNCTARYLLTLADVDAGEVRNTAEVNAAAPGGGSAKDTSGSDKNNNAETVTAIPRASAMTLVKLAGTPTTAAGLDAALIDADDTIEYTFTVKNTGNVTLSSISITDPKIAAVTCDATTLVPTATTSCRGTYELSLADLDLASVENTATSSAEGPDGTPASDKSGTDETNDTPTTVELPQTPRLTLVKSAALPTVAAGVEPTIVDVGDTIEYSFAVQNAGSVTLSGLLIEDAKVPSITCPLVTLAPGQSTICTGTYPITQIDLDAGLTTNTASATANSPTNVPTEDTSGSDPANDTPTETSIPQVSRIGLVKQTAGVIDKDGKGVSAGDEIPYTFTVHNLGNVTLTAIGVTDVQVGTVTCPTTSLAPAKTLTCTATYVLKQVDIDRGQFENTATASGTPPSGSPVTDVSDPDTPGAGDDKKTITSLEQIPGLAFVKKADETALSAPPKSGDKITYVFTIKNTGNITLTGIKIDDPLAGLVQKGGPIAELAPGDSDSKTISASYAITDADISNGFVENSAVATGNYVDKALAPRTVSDTSGTDESNGRPTRVALKAVPAISIVKTATFNDITAPTGANIGDTITYKFVVKNEGNVVLTSVSFSDDKLTGESCPADTLAVGAGMNCTADAYNLTQEDLNTGDVTNRAVAKSAARVDGQLVSVEDDSGTADNNNDPTITNLPIPTPSFTKTANKTVAKIGEQITFTITGQTIVFQPIDVVDLLPKGLTFVPGSGAVDGNTATPTVSGQRITFNNITPVGGAVTVTLRAVVNASAVTGTLTNRAELIHPNGQVVATARAKVEIRPEPVFDCGDIIGKVFDDANRNGRQDAETSPYEPERGLPGVRVTTVNGVLITTDKNGRFHIPCADIPDAQIGSNYILKVDPRSLPSGYRMTTENPKVVRLTRGKLSKINFGASIGRVVRIDLTDKVFVAGDVAMTEKLNQALNDMLPSLDEEQSILRLDYHIGGEGKDMASARLKRVSKLIADAWKSRSGPYKLPIETRLLHKTKGTEN